MTYAEIRNCLQGLTKEERAELMLDLKLLEKLDDPKYLTRLSQNVREVKAGNVVPSAELRRIFAERQQPV
ncbi:MAG: hypothetical protein ABI680_15160 [Chthoniobacteraceae bacterium]